ncbi:hypothetical protein [Streptomyces sp. NPDC051569]|uniref:hypothetical protein n=1 Tax=Streptomyces sp. NPDC051569 TaxID=3365661 RepID=UPI0037AE60FB
MIRLWVWFVLAAGALNVFLRLRFPRIVWVLSTTSGERRALMSELQRLESDPLFAAEWRDALHAEWDQRVFDRAFAELAGAMTHELRDR